MEEAKVFINIYNTYIYVILMGNSVSSYKGF